MWGVFFEKKCRRYIDEDISGGASSEEETDSVDEPAAYVEAKKDIGDVPVIENAI